MPELPEVETVCNGIKPYLEGACIVSSKVMNSKLRIPVPSNFSELIKGQKILKVKRRAKYILIYLENELVIVIHFGMSGRLKLADTSFFQEHKSEIKHDHVFIELSNNRSITYRDPRKFGLVTVLDKNEFANFRFFKKLGLEPLSSQLNADEFFKILQSSRRSVKSVIMDSSLVVGIGNIYASESLFSAGVNPERIASTVTKKEATKLYKAIVDTLEQAIKAGGSSINDYAQADGSTGYFQHHFLVYGRTDKPCKKCKTPILRIKQNGRSTYYCEKCQK